MGLCNNRFKRSFSVSSYRLAQRLQHREVGVVYGEDRNIIKYYLIYFYGIYSSIRSYASNHLYVLSFNSIQYVITHISVWFYVDKCFRLDNAACYVTHLKTLFYSLFSRTSLQLIWKHFHWTQEPFRKQILAGWRLLYFHLQIHVMSCHAMAHHAMLCHIMSHHVMYCHVMSRHVTSCHVMSCRVVSCRVVSCHVMSCHVVSCHDVSYSVRFCPVLSCPVLSCPVLSCPVLSCPVLSCLVLSGPVLSCPILSYPVLSCPILSYPVLYCPMLSYPVLSCPILSSPVLSCHVMSCHVISTERAFVVTW